MDIAEIATAVAQKYESKMKQARGATSIDEALGMQKEGFEEAMKTLLTMLMEQAVITGVCPPQGGALTAGKIT